MSLAMDSRPLATEAPANFQRLDDEQNNAAEAVPATHHASDREGETSEKSQNEVFEITTHNEKSIFALGTNQETKIS